jgi:hypothetical protein
MDARVERLRHEADGQRQVRYSPAARADAVAFAQEGRAAGRTLSAIAADLGVSTQALRRWRARPVAAFRPVVVTSAEAAGLASRGGLVVQTARGHRVEGLDLAGVVAVVRALEGRG